MNSTLTRCLGRWWGKCANLLAGMPYSLVLVMCWWTSSKVTSTLSPRRQLHTVSMVRGGGMGGPYKEAEGRGGMEACACGVSGDKSDE